MTSPYIYHTRITTILVEGQYGSGFANETAALVPASDLVSHSSHYEMYTVTIPHSRTATFTVGATVGGKKYTQTADVIASGLPICNSD